MDSPSIHVKPSYEEMKKIYQEWLRNPVGKQTEIFKKHGWSRLRFFEEATNRGDDV